MGQIRRDPLVYRLWCLFRGTRQLAALMPFGFSGVFNGAALVFFAFLGFDAVAMAAEEVEDAKKNVPRESLVPLRSQLSFISLSH